MYGDSTGRAPIHVNRITIIVTNIENGKITRIQIDENSTVLPPLLFAVG